MICYLSRQLNAKAYLVRLLRELTLLMPVRGVSSVAYVFGGSSSSSWCLGTTFSIEVVALGFWCSVEADGGLPALTDSCVVSVIVLVA